MTDAPLDPNIAETVVSEARRISFVHRDRARKILPASFVLESTDPERHFSISVAELEAIFVARRDGRTPVLPAGTVLSPWTDTNALRPA